MSVFTRVVAFLLLFLSWYAAFFIVLWPDDKLRVIFCDVGQGDSILIQRAFLQVLVDGGPNDQVLECLGQFMPIHDRKIEAVILTHPQADHLNGLIAVFERYQVDHFFSPGTENDSDGFSELETLIKKESGIAVKKVHAGMSFKAYGLSLKFLWPKSELSSAVTELADPDLNADSVVFSLIYDDFSALLTGDIREEEELALLSRRVLTNYTLLKIPHHGSKTSSSTELLRVVLPDVSVISSGAKNRFGHPHTQVLERLALFSGPVYDTQKHGTVIVETDGVKLSVKCRNSKTCLPISTN